MDIRMEITRKRVEDIRLKGAAQGLDLPQKREAPIVPFLGRTPVICELKRCSPSRKDIALDLDPMQTVKEWRVSGITNLSILTEENYFGGSLKILLDIKRAFPDLSILRKDFLVNTEDIDISWRAGADAVLLIASLLKAEALRSMYERTLHLGMTPLVEVHDDEDVEKAAFLKPRYVGINSRNLKTFTIDPLQPLRIRRHISWSCSVIYESGIKNGEEAELPIATDFQGILVGEGVVRNSELPSILLKKFRTRNDYEYKYKFWNKLYRKYNPSRPFIKICGITNRRDFGRICREETSIAGFILAESPRKTTVEFIRSCTGGELLKVGVLVLNPNEAVPGEITELLESGDLDALQFHGNETPEQVSRWPCYKAFRLRESSEIDTMADYKCPARLIDAFSPEAYGGTGKRIDSEIVNAVREKHTLWLAGGINPGNIEDILKRFKPELIDLSSGVEESPGRKDPGKLEELFRRAAKYE